MSQSLFVYTLLIGFKYGYLIVSFAHSEMVSSIVIKH